MVLLLPLPVAQVAPLLLLLPLRRRRRRRRKKKSVMNYHPHLLLHSTHLYYRKNLMTIWASVSLTKSLVLTSKIIHYCLLSLCLHCSDYDVDAMTWETAYAAYECLSIHLRNLSSTPAAKMNLLSQLLSDHQMQHRILATRANIAQPILMNLICARSATSFGIMR